MIQMAVRLLAIAVLVAVSAEQPHKKYHRARVLEKDTLAEENTTVAYHKSSRPHTSIVMNKAPESAPRLRSTSKSQKYITATVVNHIMDDDELHQGSQTPETASTPDSTFDEASRNLAEQEAALEAQLSVKRKQLATQNRKQQPQPLNSDAISQSQPKSQAQVHPQIETNSVVGTESKANPVEMETKSKKAGSEQVEVNTANKIGGSVGDGDHKQISQSSKEAQDQGPGFRQKSSLDAEIVQLKHQFDDLHEELMKEKDMARKIPETRRSLEDLKRSMEILETRKLSDALESRLNEEKKDMEKAKDLVERYGERFNIAKKSLRKIKDSFAKLSEKFEDVKKTQKRIEEGMHASKIQPPTKHKKHHSNRARFRAVHTNKEDDSSTQYDGQEVSIEAVEARMREIQDQIAKTQTY
ncbi:hypothetical protein AAMO2058_000667800 [Amorphochlora amoebiformis]